MSLLAQYNALAKACKACGKYSNQCLGCNEARGALKGFALACQSIQETHDSCVAPCLADDLEAVVEQAKAEGVL